MKRYIAEFIGTFALVFLGTGAIIVNELYQGCITHIGIVITFGLVVMTMIYSLGDISGAHMNPAVSFGFWIAKRFPGKDVFYYSISQCGGALFASLLLKLLFPNTIMLGETVPSHSWTQAFIMEVILSFFLMFVIIHVASGSKEKGIMAGTAIGATVAICAMVGGPVSGASMNPARSLGPAFVAMNLNDLWIYLMAPYIGVFLAILTCCGFRGKECCDPTNHNT